MNALFRRRLSCALAALFLLCLFLPCFGCAESCFEISEYMLDYMPKTLFPDAANPPKEVPAYFDGLLTCRAYIYNDLIWFSVKDLCTFAGGDVKLFWYPETESLAVRGGGIDISMLISTGYITMNNRYILSLGDFMMIGSEVCFPADIIYHMFSVSAELSKDGSRVNVDATDFEMLSGSRSYYEDTYGEDFTLLTYLINAEAGGAPVIGRVGVGNVVFNRVASDKFPDNIHDVIFDQVNGVQFAPTVNGRLYDPPNEISRIAAALVFEGYNTVKDAIYFDEAWADLSWIPESHFICKIGGHRFFN